jgi:hypothetical protein
MMRGERTEREMLRKQGNKIERRQKKNDDKGDNYEFVWSKKSYILDER